MLFHTRGRLALVFGVVTLAAAVSFFGAQSPAQERRVNAIWSYRNVRDVLVVWTRGGCDQAKTTCVNKGLRVLETHGAGGYHVCRCPNEANLRETVTALARAGGIAHVEPNAIIRLRQPKGKPVAATGAPAGKVGQGGIALAQRAGARRVPNDPAFGRLWGLESSRAPHAWSCVRASPVIVAVIDSGVDYNHPDLRDNMWRNPGEIAGDGRDNDRNGVVDDAFGFNALTGGGDPMDDHGHGTHCAGIIGAVGDNRTGVTGVNWAVKIMAVKVFDAEGNTNVNAIIKGIDYARQHGARVANASFAGSVRSQLQRNALARAEAAGMIFVTAAGNEGEDNDTSPQFPASFADPRDRDGALGNVISVGSLSAGESLSSFSNFGANSVQLVAPGGAGGKVASGNILSTVSAKNSGDFGASTDPGYGYAAGTSMATPHVSGAVALVWGHPSYRNAGSKEVKELILSNTRRLEELRGKCWTGGTLDLSFLCAGAAPAIALPSEPTPVVRPRLQLLLPRR